MEAADGEWVDPPWRSPLDIDAALRVIPASATITGMFIDAVVKLAADRGSPVKARRPRYVPFHPYPLREHCELLCEAGALLYSKLSMREALRKLGRGSPHVLMQSTIGRVVLGSAEGPLAVFKAMADSYAHHMRPGRLEVSSVGQSALMIELTDIYNFLDSHNVGVFEGLMKYAGVEGKLQIRTRTRIAADFRCEWET